MKENNETVCQFSGLFILNLFLTSKQEMLIVFSVSLFLSLLDESKNYRVVLDNTAIQLSTINI